MKTDSISSQTKRHSNFAGDVLRLHFSDNFFGKILSKYYNHNPIWERRRVNKHPVWGSYSVVLYKRILSLLSEYGITSGTLVDFGCGAGKFGELAESSGFSYIGIDDSKAAIELGQKTWPAMSLLEFDLAHADLPKDFHVSADVVTAINSLHCLTEDQHRRQFLRNFMLAVKPEAYLFLTTMVGPVTKNYRPSENPRLYLEPDAVISELAAYGFTRVIYRSDLPASDINGIPNLETILQKQ